MKGEPNPLFFPLDFDEQKQEVTLLPYHASLFSRLLCVLLMQNMERNVMSYQQKDSRPSKARIKSPPLSGGEVARETEEKWARTVRAKRVPQTPTATVATSQKPDNRGGASWFVFLAAKKNEQIKRINVTRTFFDWERKSLVFNLLPLPCPEALRGVVQENIGEN